MVKVAMVKEAMVDKVAIQMEAVEDTVKAKEAMEAEEALGSQEVDMDSHQVAMVETEVVKAQVEQEEVTNKTMLKQFSLAIFLSRWLKEM
jgi:hypothetical protein